MRAFTPAVNDLDRVTHNWIVRGANAVAHEMKEIAPDNVARRMQAATVRELKDKRVEFTEEISDEGFGLVTAMKLPGGGELGLYQPRHPTPLSPAE